MATTLFTIGSLAVTLGDALIATTAAVAIAGATYGGISSYQQGQAQAAASRDAAASARLQSEIQANAATTQANLQSAEYMRQAKLEDARAGIEQIQGEQEAEKRSRALAANVGNVYANYAGNGLLVDGSPRDTLGAALRTTVAEGQADISTIRDNTAMNVWTRQTNAAALRQSARNAQEYGASTARSYLTAGIGESMSLLNQGSIAKSSGTSGAISSGFGGATSALSVATKFGSFKKS